MERVLLVLVVQILCAFPHNLFAQSDQWYATPSDTRVDFEDAREQHRNVLFGGPAHPGRMALEQTTTLVLGSAWYWVYKDLNSTDWDLQPTLTNFGRRFHDPSLIRFDTNRFFVNQGHVLAGSVHYAIPRNNNFGPFASLGVGALTSALWEWVFEYREYVSLNDLITSPYGGQPLGEVTFKFGELYDRERARLSLPAKILTFAFGQGRALHRALGDEEPTFDPAFGPEFAYDFHASAGAVMLGPTVVEPATGGGSFRLRTNVIDLPGYQRPGVFSTFYRDGNFTRFDLELLFGGRPALQRLSARASAELLGYYAQSIDDDGRGWSARIGFGRSTLIETRELETKEFLGVVDVAGPVASFDVFAGHLHLQFGAAVYGDFASVASHAYAERADEFAPESLRSELQLEGYYFAWGITTTPYAAATVGRWTTRLNLDLSWFHGLHGPDRLHHNDIPQRVVLRDQRTLARFESKFRIAGPVDIGLRFERLSRRSRLDDLRAVRTVDELSLNLGAAF